MSLDVSQKRQILSKRCNALNHGVFVVESMVTGTLALGGEVTTCCRLACDVVVGCYGFGSELTVFVKSAGFLG